MEFRQVDLEDLSVLVTLFVTTFNAPPWSETWTEEGALACLQDLLALPRAWSLAACDVPTCLGAVLGYDIVKDFGLAHEVREMFVHPGTQGRGVGRELLQSHLTAAGERGVLSVYLLTARESPAESFYTRLGFRHARRQVVLVRP